jgi:HSP20 family molecular chaperone IbpA
MTKIPYDVYESPFEVAIILPLWWVKKESITLKIRYETIFITWQRTAPVLRKDFHPIQNACFWGDIDIAIDLPPESNYKSMTSNLSKENILTIIIPKNIIPEHIPLQIED